MASCDFRGVIDFSNESGGVKADETELAEVVPVLNSGTTLAAGQTRLVAQKTASLFEDLNGDGLINQNEEVLFTVVVENKGNFTATNVEFFDAFNVANMTGWIVDPESIFPDTFPSNYDFVSGTLAITVGDIPAGESRLFSFRARPITTGDTRFQTLEFTNLALVRGDNFLNVLTDLDLDENDPEEPTTVEIDPLILDPVVVKDDVLVEDLNGDGQVNNGEKIRYTITAYNGTDSPLRDLVLEDNVALKDLLVDEASTVRRGCGRMR